MNEAIELTRRRPERTRIGVHTNDDAFWPALRMKILELAEERQWQLVNLEKYGKYLPERLNVSGAMVVQLPGDPIVDHLLDHGVPTVRIGKAPHPDDQLMPAIIPDVTEAGKIAADHFIDRGFENLAYVGREPWGDSKGLYQAFAEQAEERGVTCHLLRFEDAHYPRSTRRARRLARQETFTTWLQSLPRPVGLLSYSDHVGDLYCQWADDMGWRVPEDVAILGKGNDEFVCESALTSLSSIGRNAQDHAQIAIDTLQRLMDGQTLEQFTFKVKPDGIVTRHSTDVKAASNPDVINALSYMWDHLGDDLSVEDITREVGVSRRKLERAFMEELGSTIWQQYTARRLEKACELLTTTDLPIATIAKAVGHGSQSHFSQLFSSTFGITPRDYRKNR